MKRKLIIKKRQEDMGMHKTEAENMQLEFLRIKDQKKILETREKDLRDKLSEYMSKVFKPDSKGHFLFTTLDETGNKIHLQKQSRKKIDLDQDKAIKFLEENDLEHLIHSKDVISAEVTDDQILDLVEKHEPTFIEEVKTVDENALAQAVINEELTLEEFEDMCEIKITYAMTYVDDKKLVLEEGD